MHYFPMQRVLIGIGKIPIACTGPMHFNACFYAECLDARLSLVGENNILEESVSTSLGSANTLALLLVQEALLWVQDAWNEAIRVPF